MKIALLKWVGTGALCILALLVLLLIIWLIMSPGKIRTYDTPNGLSEKFVMDVNGAPNGFFINSVDTDNPVLLLVSSGPGTDDYVFTDKYKDMRLEEYYTVVYWDYRYMGIAYGSDFDAESITLENLLNDTYSVTEYLKERFHKDKIYIMGFSGGTQIALREAARHPENYYAYIGMAQCVTDSDERDALMYDFMKKTFEERGDRKSLKRLEDSIERSGDGSIRCKSWYDYVYLLHDAGGGTIRGKSEFTGIAWPVITCRCYTLREKIGYIPAMKKYRNTPLDKDLEGFDYRQDLTSLAIPAYFISGEYDYNCPWELVEEYCDILSAPDKGFFKIKDSAHSPLWENAKDTMEVMLQIRERTENG
ncbi:MAG: alpha/beta hydrolase [Lachnospiraceae bacterium]|nr:alpha/beta hydrolase [Lachnospiraceae bacterium]